MLGTQLLTCALGTVQRSPAFPGVLRDQPALLGAQDAQLLLPRVSKLITGNTLIKDSEFLTSPLWVFKG